MSKITRRDFINGALVTAGSSILSFDANGQAAMAALDPSYYPPTLTGLRGSHPGSNDYAHARAWAGRSDWGSTSKLSETYDLVVVGGGISGLAAAYFYQQKHGAHKKILILDNHDDFGGHAKRNEHTIDGNTRIAYGGSQTIVDPNHANKVVLDLMEDIGIDLERFESAYDMGFFKRHDLGGVTYFNEEVFGEDKVVQHPYCNYPNYVEGLQGAKLSNEEAAQQAPVSHKGKEQLLRVLNGGLHSLPVPEEELQDYISTHSYYDYLMNTFGVDDPGVLRMARHSGLDWGSGGTDVMSIAAAKSCGALGFAPVAVYDENNPYIHHFPDGNAGVARALVKKLIPDVARGNNAEELVLAKFNYAELDKPGNIVRVRLNSTAINVEHVGDAGTSGDVLVNYINDKTSYQVRAKGVVMACYNAIIPHIVSGLPRAQAEALLVQGKSPLQYTSVGVRNWRGMKELGIGMAMSPGHMHQAVHMDFPVSMGGYEYTKTPDDPCVIQMISCPYGTVGDTRLEQFREARYKMLSLQFDDYEQEIRRHLSGMLPEKLFDFDRDVASISVNRWAHGYSLGGPGDSTRIGRQPFGRITVANCDSAPGSDAKTAMMMAHRAVNELE
ncbi:MAG: NAD(P)/FAD-dependent oxidoreductase [Woeseia sp.]|jgi:spermidine dehydrogenase|nr:NAD(P)/FAD-dependent oxidoreductase [Woeseia sp.]MBT6211832.1 NAD(P)/FAD-dependent oxidoreductase [Woeseia sp.]